ncbi:MAG: TIM barrel protein [Pseudomonadota bacterium]|nr:TIM barrel protein [Pseudomonadota bacterium]
MSFALRYAPHLGFRGFDTPLFAHAAPSRDPVDQISFAAAQGFAGLQDPWFTSRPEVDKARIAEALAASGLAAGTLGIGSLADLRQPLWFPDNASGESALKAACDRAFRDAARIGARDLAIVPAGATALGQEDAETVFATRLTELAEIASRGGFTLNLEVVDPAAIPGQLFTSFAQAARVVRRIGHPAVRLIYDTGHLIATDGDIMTPLTRDADIIGPIQIAGQPGRCEPAADPRILPVLKVLAAQDFRGLVELEHLWADPTAASETAGIDWLHAIDADLTQAKRTGS